MRGTAQDRLALFVLSRRHQLRRRLAVPGDLAGQGAPSARRLDLRRRPASRRAGGRRARPRQGRADDELRPQHPPAGDAGPRQRRRPGRAAGGAGDDRQGERRRPRMALSRPADRRDAEAVVDARAALLRRDARRARRVRLYRRRAAERRAGQGGGGRHRRRRRQLHVGAAGGDGPRRRPGGGRARAEPRAPRRLARLRRRRLRFHLHPQGLRPADPREMAALGFA